MDATDRILSSLPASLALRLDGYVSAIERALPDIIDGRDKDLSKPDREAILLAALTRQIWIMIDAQYSIFNRAAAIAEENGFVGFQAGRREISRASDDLDQLARFRREFMKQLQELGLWDVVLSRSLGEMVEITLGDKRRDGF